MKEDQESKSTYLEVTVNGISFKMVKVEGDTFTMGATPEQANDADNDEKPAHQVTLSDYYIGQFPVTEELWKTVMGNPNNEIANIGYPKKEVSWDDIVDDFLPKLNELTGMTFTLPTEAQWEYAARGGNKSMGYKYSGSNNIDDVAWYNDNSNGQTHPVGQKLPNELGIHDMSGNTWEWCSDRYGKYGHEPQKDPIGSSSSREHVLRGGCCDYDEENCRVMHRRCDSSDCREDKYGFRLVLSEIISIKEESLNLVQWELSDEPHVQINGINIPNSVFEWSSSEPDIASVDADGSISAHRAGHSVITAKSKCSGKEVSWPVNVDSACTPEQIAKADDLLKQLTDTLISLYSTDRDFDSIELELGDYSLMISQCPVDEDVLWVIRIDYELFTYIPQSYLDSSAEVSISQRLGMKKEEFIKCLYCSDHIDFTEIISTENNYWENDDAFLNADLFSRMDNPSIHRYSDRYYKTWRKDKFKRSGFATKIYDLDELKESDVYDAFHQEGMDCKAIFSDQTGHYFRLWVECAHCSDLSYNYFLDERDKNDNLLRQWTSFEWRGSYESSAHFFYQTMRELKSCIVPQPLTEADSRTAAELISKTASEVDDVLHDDSMPSLQRIQTIHKTCSATLTRISDLNGGQIYFEAVGKDDNTEFYEIVAWHIKGCAEERGSFVPYALKDGIVYNDDQSMSVSLSGLNTVQLIKLLNMVQNETTGIHSEIFALDNVEQILAQLYSKEIILLLRENPYLLDRKYEKTITYLKYSDNLYTEVDDDDDSYWLPVDLEQLTMDDDGFIVDFILQADDPVLVRTRLNQAAWESDLGFDGLENLYQLLLCRCRK